MRSNKTAVLIAAALAAIALFYFVLSGKDNPPALDKDDATTTSSASSSSNNVVPSTPASTETEAVPASNETASANASDNAVAQTASVANAPGISATSTQYPPLNAYDIAQEVINENDLAELIDRLKNDPELRASLIDEFRAETNPDRIDRLVFILGQTGTSDVLPVAEELVYSGDKHSRKAGLNLLNQIAPNNPEAIDVANSILGGETEPDVLVATMNVFAQPAGATPEIRGALVAQITPLASHEAAAVRRHSVQVLTRLSNEPDIAPVLTNALYDQDSSVREAATYAYAEYPYQTEEVLQRLLEIAESQTEENGTRRGAMFALSKMSPDEQTKQRIIEARKQLRKSLRNR